MNPYGLPPEPKSGASANSANRANIFLSKKKWSGRRDSNSRPSPWQGDALPLSHFRTLCFFFIFFYRKMGTRKFPSFSCIGDSTGNRTRVTAVKGRCLNHLTMGPEKTGNVLLSQAASRQVSSALRSLTTVFEMGTGVTSSLLSPDFLIEGSHPQN